MNPHATEKMGRVLAAGLLTAAVAQAVTAGTTAPVRYYDHAQVAAAFAKGAVLYAGEDGANYMVHASRREQAGLAEVHNLDTDIIYVLDGTATFVTGGNVADPKTVEPHEVRGSAIDGGQVTDLAKGDVIIVPKGTPHWFKEVPAPFVYYVVKVR